MFYYSLMLMNSPNEICVKMEYCLKTNKQTNKKHYIYIYLYIRGFFGAVVFMCDFNLITNR